MSTSNIRGLLVAMVVLISCIILYGYFTQIRAAVQIYNDNEESEYYRKNYLKNNAALRIYIDSTNLYAKKFNEVKFSNDSIVKIMVKNDSTIKNLKNELKKNTTTDSHNRINVYDLWPNSN